VHVPAAGPRQSLVFPSDGEVEYDGPTERMEFQRHVRYRFVDDRTVALLLTATALRGPPDQVTNPTGRRPPPKVGDEFGRVKVASPSAGAMVLTYANGNRVTWQKAD